MSTIRFPLPSDPAKYVDLKSSWTFGDTKAIAQANAAGANEVSGAIASTEVLLERFVVGWNLTEEAPSPATLDSVLKDTDAMAIIKKCFELREPTVAGKEGTNGAG